MAEFLPFVRRWFDATFSEATRPQREGWDAIASGRDTLIVAPTGSGKTLAAFLWALDHLHRLGLERRLEDRVYVVYVSPLRALNNDIEKNLQAPLAGIRAAALDMGVTPPEVRVAVRTGDTLASQRQAMTRRPPHVLITTPESLYILLTAERFRPALASVRFVIVDEVHALMGGKRGTHLALSLERLQALCAASDGMRPPRIGCSATVRPVEDALAFLTGTTARDPVVIDAGFSRELDIEVVSPVDDFLTAQSDTIWEATLQHIAELVATHRTTLVFAQSRRAAERLARDLDDRIGGALVAAHHGSLSRRARLDAENRLKNGELKALVATSSLELGIDVGAIDLVIQVQSPRNVAAALQRVGRAGHLLSRVSKGRSVVTRGGELVEAAAVVRSIRERTLDRIAAPEAPLDVLAQQIVAEVAAESISVDDLHARFRRATPYRSLSREDFVSVVRSVAEPLPAEVRALSPASCGTASTIACTPGAARDSSRSPRAAPSPMPGSTTSSSPTPTSRSVRSTRSLSPRASPATCSCWARTRGGSSRSAAAGCSSTTRRGCRPRFPSGRVNIPRAPTTWAWPSGDCAARPPGGSTRRTMPTGRGASVVSTRARPRRCARGS